MRKRSQTRVVKFQELPKAPGFQNSWFEDLQNQKQDFFGTFATIIQTIDNTVIFCFACQEVKREFACTSIRRNFSVLIASD
jgi:hypothetical protein